MNIVIIGAGRVGLVTGSCFAEMGNNVTVIDIDENKIQRLRENIVSFYEPDLERLVRKNHKVGRLHFEIDLANCLKRVKAIFIAVGTPSNNDGTANLCQVLEASRNIGRNIKHDILVVIKSTVPVGTSQKIKSIIQEELDKRRVGISIEIVSNPEFLKEGTAIKDFMNPDRVIVGVENEKVQKLIDELYKPYRIIYTDIPSAEMIKYVANAMLATRISFMNDIANLCSLIGVDINMVRIGIGFDSRIGTKFLYSGCGYGGSCFPKDIKALIQIGYTNGYAMQLLQAVEAVNNNQKTILFDKLLRIFENNLKGKIVALWGLSFKPNTDDICESPALTLIDALLKAGAIIQVYDPVALEETRRHFGNKLYYYTNMYDAAKNADVLLLLTEWKEFYSPSWELLKKTMGHSILLDGRNIYDKKKMHLNGFTYIHI
ncbi:UDP-glucose dehydrogenase family protein [Candidatus Azobacteroides pseudotrichonymphae]|uniref:UDP-glucose 6-dehydrogenase n=1 Tax=Azobacteroides pseudotrichonymphae genomovar. CFP2 TaxID=511995 RepID=B6YRN6_AZOPC|nr:UDP-glucose/GDP-mannose dehydrogenase family protein [Candidatus Azobacteroides pseudotrichonymphae]BAG83858.1 UDP-glucose 6-dehydrogenase [Candidatus Azobacteroides pseudotrichonymphae genomovar. CFP2]